MDPEEPTLTTPCPEEIVITQQNIADGGVTQLAWDGVEAVFPFNSWVGMEAGGACVVKIRTEGNPTDADFGSKVRSGSFVLNQWGEDVDVSITRMANGAPFDENISALYSKETFYLNREAKDGDLTGAVPVKPGNSWMAVFINYDLENYDWVEVEYGAASHLVATSATLAAALLTAYAF